VTAPNVGGSDFLIIGAIKAGHRQVPAIANWARVEQMFARAVLNRLRTQGKVRRYGNTRSAKYSLVEEAEVGPMKAPPLLDNTLNIFIGWDSRETIAYSVLADSIIRRASIPVTIAPLRLSALKMIYTRGRGPTESTEFSLTRFLVPYLSHYRGLSLFMDCDMLVQGDIADVLLYALVHPNKAVHVCQHDYTPRAGAKFFGQVQTAYPRKNWSSFMLFNNARCCALTPEYVNTASGLDLHRFNWLSGDDDIGSLPLDFNWLVGEYAPNDRARVLHWTLGGPWLPDYEDCEHAELWRQSLRQMFGEPLEVAPV
jgi:hypothetical protein